METTNDNVVAINEILTRIIKRGFDIFASFFGLIFLSPLLIGTIIAIRLESKGKAIFTQERIGKDGKLFKFYKFRSMVTNADEILEKMLKEDTEQTREYKLNKKLTEDPRVTKVGKFIRRTSIDELPQLINVLKGEMSLIGNRPYLPREKEDMGTYYNDIVKTKPGITGLWQVSGRSNTTFEDRLKLEKEYSNTCSIKLDIKIFFKTIKVVLNMVGAK